MLLLTMSADWWIMQLASYQHRLHCIWNICKTFHLHVTSEVHSSNSGIVPCPDVGSKSSDFPWLECFYSAGIQTSVISMCHIPDSTEFI